MLRDHIVEEVRKVRDEYAKRFHYELDAICRDLRERQAKNGRKVVSFLSRRIKLLEQPVLEKQ